MIELQYNPFALFTANATWSNPDSSMPVRALKATAGTLNDILIKNPYELSIGNAI